MVSLSYQRAWAGLGSLTFFSKVSQPQGPLQLKTRRCLTAQQMWSSHAGPSLPALGPRACLLSPVETQMGTPQPHELPRVEGIQLGGMQSGGTERGKGPRHSTGRESDPEAAPGDVAHPREQLAATAPS